MCQEQKANVITSDLCIVEDQGTHVVVGIRVPREMISENHPFFAMMAGQQIKLRRRMPAAVAEAIAAGIGCLVATILFLSIQQPLNASSSGPTVESEHASAFEYCMPTYASKFKIRARADRDDKLTVIEKTHAE